MLLPSEGSQFILTLHSLSGLVVQCPYHSTLLWILDLILLVPHLPLIPSFLIETQAVCDPLLVISYVSANKKKILQGVKKY
jgi:hypothetical protein